MIILSNNEQHEIGKPFIPVIGVIARSLSFVNRYNGHVGKYSVAQHCVLVARQLPDELKLAGLLHDAPEAFIGDVSAPLKKHLPDYKKIEDFYHGVIDKHFSIDTNHPLVKLADMRMLITEAKHFGIHCDAFPDFEPYNIEIERWSESKSFVEFTMLYAELTQTT